MAKKLTQIKARKMLHEGIVRGHPITRKQRGLFGVITSGKKPRRMARARGRRRRG